MEGRTTAAAGVIPVSLSPGSVPAGLAPWCHPACAETQGFCSLLPLASPLSPVSDPDHQKCQEVSLTFHT